METQPTAPTWSVIGHDWAVDLLRSAVAGGSLSHALLITGAPNVGKGTLARSLAQALLCRADLVPCGVCGACRSVARSSHPDLLWVEPHGGSLKIAQVRELTRHLALTPVQGPRKIAVLDRFEMATPGAANALLKTLEEPPPSVVLVLLAQQAEALLPTIVSRCQIIALRPIARASIERALTQHWGVDTEKAQVLSHICGGRLGWAISTLTSPELLEQRSQRLDDMIRLLRSKRSTRFAYAEALARQAPESILESVELWMGWWRDLLLLSSHSAVPLTNLDHRTELVQIARVFDMTTARTTLAALQSTVDQLSQNANARLALEVLFLNLPFLE